MSKKLLESLVEVASYLNKYFVEDFGVLVVDKEKVLIYQPGEKIDFDIETGDSLNSAWATYKAMERKEKIVEEFDASVTGVPYIGIGHPIYDDEGQEVIGAIAISRATDRKEKLLEVSRNLSNYTETFASNLEQVSAEAEEMAATGEELNSISEETKQKVDQSEEIVNFVKEIAEEINMIGLNASIEAARVGEEGRGFAVVADEVQRLASNTSDSISEMENMFQKMKDVIQESYEATSQISKISEEQAEKLVNINEKVHQLSDLGKDVVELAESLDSSE